MFLIVFDCFNDNHQASNASSTILIIKMFILDSRPGADPGFIERGFMFIKGWGFALLILSHFS